MVFIEGMVPTLDMIWAVFGLWAIAVIWALDVLTPPWPTSEILIVAPLKAAGIPIIVGEIISIVLALFIVGAAFFFYPPIIGMIFAGVEMFIFSPLGIIVTVALAGFYLIAIYKLGG